MPSTISIGTPTGGGTPGSAGGSVMAAPTPPAGVLTIVSTPDPDTVTVATNIADIKTVADNIAAIAGVFAKSVEIDSVLAIKDNIKTIVDNLNDILTIGDSDVDYKLLADSIPDFKATLASLTAIQDVLTIKADISALYQLKSAIASLTSIQSTLTALEADKALYTAVDGISADVKEVAKNIVAVTAIAGDAVWLKDLYDNKATYDNLKSMEADLKKWIATEETAKKVLAIVDDLPAIVAKMDSELQVLCENLLNRFRMEAEESIAEFDSMLADWERQVTKITDRLTALEATDKIHTADIEQNKKDIDQLKADVISLTAQFLEHVDENVKEFADVKISLNTLENTLSNLDQDIKDVDAKVEKNIEAIDAIEKNIVAMGTMIASFKGEYDGILKVLRDDVDDNTADITNIMNNIHYIDVENINKTLSAAIAELRGRYTTFAEITDLTFDLKETENFKATLTTGATVDFQNINVGSQGTILINDASLISGWGNAVWKAGNEPAVSAMTGAFVLRYLAISETQVVLERIY